MRDEGMRDDEEADALPSNNRQVALLIRGSYRSIKKGNLEHAKRALDLTYACLPSNCAVLNCWLFIICRCSFSSLFFMYFEVFVSL